MKNPWKKYSKINPQRENGHREIANDVYYALLSANFTGAEYKIILAIIDKTWGFGKDNDSIAIGQFAKMTNLSGRTIQRTLKKLHRLRVVYLSPFGRRVPTGSPLNKYSFNKHYDTWKVEGCQIVQGCQLGHSPKASKGDIHGRIRVTSGPPTKETITKETITKENAVKIKEFDLFYTIYPKKVGKQGAKDKWISLLKKDKLPFLDIILTAIKKQTAWREKANGEFRPEWKNPSTWLHQGCWDDETKTESSLDTSMFG